jgi:NAD(P)H dehydrogenase (quinone)
MAHRKESIVERVLILGATGNIGALAANRLIRENVILRLVSSRESGVHSLRERFPTAEVMQADWYDPVSLKTAMRDVDRVFIVTPDFVTDETVVTPNIIEAVRDAGSVAQILRLSAMPPGLKATDVSKEVLATRCGAAQHMVAKPLLDASGLPITYLNVACWIMFNLSWYLSEPVKTKQQLLMPAVTDAPRRWVSEEDIADVIVRILTDKPEIHIGQDYLMTGAEQFDYEDVARLLSDVTGKAITYVDDDSMLRTSMGDHFDAVMTYYTHESRDYVSVPASDAKLKILGVRQMTFQEYLTKNIAMFV